MDKKSTEYLAGRNLLVHEMLNTDRILPDLLQVYLCAAGESHTPKKTATIYKYFRYSFNIYNLHHYR